MSNGIDYCYVGLFVGMVVGMVVGMAVGLVAGMLIGLVVKLDWYWVMWFNECWYMLTVDDLMIMLLLNVH